ncbi:MAG: 4-hydroxy-tetrahydrodipicolinate synthase [Moraxellaceae bacterium]|nr:4-hydroxy-tetrahydrodipicolinate synthase [Moraxellaceae bacterium]MDP1776231.1 4-hydroxy-tetrahydrodipicolinate synthase [Moraxellaceae bacterium]MDZ4297269.1 4-hydroxy-tetrahydrodipicolinate synthase [Moraxellaceae bacterium]MDZ4387331.1 4-hydroxy-tetrahydrodipicolinate synthase [Moraxellaceae bacterium]
MIIGSLVALVTPMQDDGQVDWLALTQLVEWHVAAGTHGIVAVGTTGESPTLAVDEHLAVIRTVVEVAAGRLAVIAGTGANSTREAIELTAAAAQIGVDAALLVTPYYNKPTQEGLYQHYKAIAEAVSLPQILYNVPGRTGVDMQNATVARLIGVPNIVGIKDATGDVARGIELIGLLGDHMAVYSGDDATAIDLILNGAKGNISVTANVAPEVMAQACEAALAGDAERAHGLSNQLAELNQVLFIESNPIPVKWALTEMGRIGLGIRLPLTVLSEAAQPRVRAALQASGVI